MMKRFLCVLLILLAFMFAFCACGKNEDLPVTEIGWYAFSSCYSLTSIVIPDSVTIVGFKAFYECYYLTIYCEAESKPTGWEDKFVYYDCPVVWGYDS